MSIDPLFFAAVAAFGWGLNLATYRLAAQRLGWPMGVAQARYGLFTSAVGAAGILAGTAFALGGAGAPGTATVLLAGLLFGAFWTGFMRVASQSALILTPMAILVLAAGWLARALG